MKSSDILSATADPTRRSGPETPPSTPASTTRPPSRTQFALLGPSPALDPRIDAVRPDLADIRLASRVFAPHYAAPVTVRLSQAAALRTEPDGGSEVLATLEAGATFEVLERAGGRLWGVAPDRQLVGYLDEAVL